jgi:hypothetical protein
MSKNKKLTGIIWLYDDGSHAFEEVKAPKKTDKVSTSLVQWIKTNIQRGIKFKAPD